MNVQSLQSEELVQTQSDISGLYFCVLIGLARLGLVEFSI